MEDKREKECINFSYGDKEKDSIWFDCGICINFKCNRIGERYSCTKGCSIGPECEDFNCNNCVNFKEVEKGENMNINEKFKIIKALNFITNLRDENYVKLDSMKKSIQDKNNKTTYNTGVYDGRIENCNTVLEALEKQVPYKLTQLDKETLTGICKCGRVTEVIDCDHYCKYCGQKVTK